MANVFFDAAIDKDDENKKAATPALKHKPQAISGLDSAANVHAASDLAQAPRNVFFEAAQEGVPNKYEHSLYGFSDVAKQYAAEAKTGAVSAVAGIGNAVRLLPRSSSSEMARDMDKLTARLSESAKRLNEETMAGRERLGMTSYEGDVMRGLGQLGAFAPTLFAGPAVYAGAVGTSTLGNSYDEARTQGATHEQALKYAAANALTQGAIESLAGPGAGKVMSGVAAKALPNIGGSIAGGLIKNAAGEGLEETLGYEAERRLGNAFLDREQKFSAKEMLYQGVVGSTVGGAYGAANIATGRPAQNKAQVEAQERLWQTDEGTQIRKSEDKQFSGAVTDPSAHAQSDAAISPEIDISVPQVADTVNKPMQQIIAEYQEATDPQFAEFARQAINNPADNRSNYVLSEVNQREIADIQRLTGIDIEGYAHNVRVDNVRHIIKRHGPQGSHDQSMANVDDIARINYVLHNYDEVSLSGTNNHYKNSDGSAAFCVMYKKRVNGTYVIVEAVPDSKAKKMQVVTAYMQKARPEPDVPKSPGLTSENEPAAASNSIISNTKDSVNGWRVDDNGDDLPRGVADNTLVKAAEAGVMGIQGIVEGMDANAFSYARQKLDDTQAQAVATINKKGLAGATAEIQSALNSGKLNSQEMAAAVELIKHYGQSNTPGDLDMAVNLTEGLMRTATDMGRAINALKLLQRISPAGLLRYANQQLDSYNRRKDTNIQLTAAEQADIAILGEIARTGNLKVDTSSASSDLKSWLTKAALWEATGRLDVGQAATAKSMAITESKIPSTGRQKLRALQRISMLSNPKTHVRNIVGNAFLAVGETAAHPLAYVFDRLMQRTTGQRTVGSGGAAARAKGAVEGWKNAKMEQDLGIDLQGSKYNESADFGAGQVRGKAFSDSNALGKFLNDVDSFITYGLKLGDEPFRNGQYESVLAQIMKANNVTEPTAEMIQAAHESSLRRTYQDDNALTQAVQKIRNAAGPFGDIIAPFVKTPVNVIKVGLEYSPIGTVQAIAKAYWGKNALTKLQAGGESTLALQRQCAELFGRGMVGTGLMFLGGLLKLAGYATGDDEENEKERAWSRTQGHKANALKIGDTYYDLSTLQTAAVPIIAGAAGSGKLNMTQALQAMMSVGNTALEMPVLQGLQELLGGSYSDTSIIEGIIGLGMNAGGQIVPFGSVLRQTATAMDTEARTTASRAENPLQRELERGANNIKSMIPGLRETLPQTYNMLGEANKSYEADSAMGRLFNVYLNPLNTSKEKTSPVIEEINRLFTQTQNRDVLPRLASNDVTYNGAKYRFDTAEKQEFQRVEGQTLSEALQTLISSTEYKSAGTEQQVKMIKDLQDFAADTAKADYLAGQRVDYSSGDWKDKVRRLENVGISNGEAILYRAVLNTFEDNDQKGEYLYGISYLSPEKKKALDEAFITYGTYIPKEMDVDYSSYDSFLISRLSPTGQRNWPAAQTWGLSAKQYAHLQPLTATGNGRKKEDAIADLIAAGLNRAQAEYFYKLANKK